MRLENEKSSNTFICALKGIGQAIKTERNFKFDLFAGTLVIAAGIFFRISITEWIVCIALIGLVLFAELTNTAIETTVDMFTREKNAYAGRAKDIAAGAVLITAITSAIIGGIIFIPKFVNFLGK